MARISATVALACVVAGLFAVPLAANPGPSGRMPAILTSAPGNAMPACVTPDRLTAFLLARNPTVASRHRNIAEIYRVTGEAYGLRWDYAFFQMLVETNNLSFVHADGTPRPVRPEQNNFAGIGAVGAGNSGSAFADVATGVQAHIEHVMIYAGETIARPVADRTRKVQSWGVLKPWLAEFNRPITFYDLGLRWFPFNNAYANNLSAVANKFFAAHCPGLRTGRGGISQSARPRTAALSSGWVSAVGDDGPASKTNAALPLTPPVPQLAAQPAPTSARTRPSIPKQRPRAAVLQRRVAALDRGAPATRQTPVARAKPQPSVRKHQAPRPKAKVRKKPSPNDQVRALVAGRTVHLKTDMGAVIPVRFDKTGRMRGQAGNLAFFLGAAKDSGRWWVKNAKLCKQWRVWLSAKKMCLKLERRGRIVHWRSEDGRSGTAKIVR
ncbi:MAG: hypothetical protein AAFR70_13935 [Pseudomonadota bacterium]